MLSLLVVKYSDPKLLYDSDKSGLKWTDSEQAKNVPDMGAVQQFLDLWGAMPKFCGWSKLGTGDVQLMKEAAST